MSLLGIFSTISPIEASDLKILPEQFSAPLPAGDDLITMEVPLTDASAPSVSGAVPASPSEWPATLVFKGPAGECTSTVIGEKVILTAAHCIPNGALGQIVIGEATTRVLCLHHPEYLSDYRFDVALCATENKIKLPNELPYEQISMAALVPRVGTNVTLLGYGCRQKGGTGPAGKLYVGTSPVDQISGPYVTTMGGAALCYGDSGGAGYYFASPIRRVVFGINSRGDLITRSNLTQIANPQVAAFFADFSTLNNLPICGFNADSSNCHN